MTPEPDPPAQDPKDDPPPTPRATMPTYTRLGPSLPGVAGNEVANEVALLKGATAAELAGPLAVKAMRLLERGMNDLNPRVAFEAARVAASVAPKVAELAAGEVKDADPEAKRAAMLAAFTDPEVVALLLEVVRSSEAPARRALEGAGWRAPGAD